MLLLWVAVLALEAMALIAANRIPFADDMQGSLRGESQAYERYSELLEDYGRVDGDIVVLFEADDFSQPASHRVVAEFLIEVQFLPHVEAVISPFSFSQTLPDGTEEPLFLDEMAPEDLRARLQNALDEQPRLSRLLHADLGAMQALLLTSDLPVQTRARSQTISEFETLAETLSQDSTVKISLAGYPVLRNTVTRKLDADTALLNTLGVVAGLVVAWIALRSLVLSLAIAITAHTARLWSITALMPLGFEINAVTITLPTLIVVLAFSEAIHLSMAARRTCHDGQPAPLKRAVAAVWPAAALAALTTCGAFGALFLSKSDLVTGLALFGVLAIMISTPLTFGLLLLIFATMDRFFGLARILRPLGTSKEQPQRLRSLKAIISGHAGKLSLCGVVLVSFTTLGYTALQPNTSLYEGLRENDPEMQTVRRIEAKFGPVTSLTFEHPIAPHEDLRHAITALSGLSPWGPAFALSENGGEGLPDGLRDRVVSADGKRTLVNIPYLYGGAAKARSDITALEKEIQSVPALEALGATTGVVHVSSFVSAEILRAFSLCFSLAAAMAGFCIAIWLRHPMLGLLSVLPNVLPITAMGSLMWLLDIPFNFISGIALTIAFGIAVDDAAHLLNRIRTESRSQGGWTEASILSALQGIGPTLIMTSAILIGGLSGTLFASLPSVANFGLLTISVFLLALLANLVLLPALLVWFVKIRSKQAGSIA